MGGTPPFIDPFADNTSVPNSPVPPAPEQQGPVAPDQGPAAPATQQAPPTQAPPDNRFTAPASASQPPQTPQPFWKTLLQGALNGLAGARGATHFGGGLAGGAAGNLAQNQEQTENQLKFRFASLQDAQLAAQKTKDMAEQEHWSAEMKNAQDELALRKNQFYRSMGFNITPFPRTPEATSTMLQTNGGVVPPYTHNDSDTIYAVTPGADNGYRAQQQLAIAVGAMPKSSQEWQMMNPAARSAHESILDKRLAGMKPQELNNAIQTYKSRPDADDATLGMLQAHVPLAQGKAADVENPKISDEQRRLANAKDLAQFRQQLKNSANGGTFVPGVSNDERKKAELAENIAYNANEVNKTLARRPDLVGAIAGRFTNIDQLKGNDDADISAIGNHIHNIAMANSGVHGFRNQQGVKETEMNLLNNFHNGPHAVAGALNANTSSVQTFIDNARPSNFPTHSSQGGAAAFYSGQKSAQPAAPQAGGSTGKGVSLAAARQLPAFKGQSDAAITAAIKAQGHTVLP